jgi:hypothetical protein
MFFMPTTNDLIVLQKLEDLTIILHNLLETIPKKEQFALSEDIKKQAYLIFRLMVHANALRSGRKECFTRLSEEFDFLLYLIRIVYRLGHFSVKQYMNLVKKHNEVVRICCGWLSNTDSEK